MIRDKPMQSNRREFLQQNALGLGALALAWLLQQQADATPKNVPKQ